MGGGLGLCLGHDRWLLPRARCGSNPLTLTLTLTLILALTLALRSPNPNPNPNPSPNQVLPSASACHHSGGSPSGRARLLLGIGWGVVGIGPPPRRSGPRRRRSGCMRTVRRPASHQASCNYWVVLVDCGHERGSRGRGILHIIILSLIKRPRTRLSVLR